MEEMTCSDCGAPLQDGEPHCPQCNATMTCKDGTCSCQCGNTMSQDEAKCDACLGM